MGHRSAMISRRRDELRKWAVPAAILMLAAIDAVAHSALARSDSLFEPWKTVPSSTERHRHPPSDAGGGRSVMSPRVSRDNSSDDKQLAPRLRRQVVEYPTSETPGSIIVDTTNTYLYFIMGNGLATRYGIGVGREGFMWTGREKISRMAEWPDWRPPAEMIERAPYIWAGHSTASTEPTTLRPSGTLSPRGVSGCAIRISWISISASRLVRWWSWSAVRVRVPVQRSPRDNLHDRRRSLGWTVLICPTDPRSAHLGGGVLRFFKSKVVGRRRLTSV